MNEILCEACNIKMERIKQSLYRSVESPTIMTDATSTSAATPYTITSTSTESIPKPKDEFVPPKINIIEYSCPKCGRRKQIA